MDNPWIFQHPKVLKLSDFGGFARPTVTIGISLGAPRALAFQNAQTKRNLASVRREAQGARSLTIET